MKALDGKKTLASRFSFECGCVCPQTGQVFTYSLILLCIVLCGVFGSVPLGRASLACLGCPCFGWPLPVRFSCGFLPWRCGAPLFRCCCWVVLVWLSSPFLFALVAWVLAVGPLSPGFPPFPPPLVVFWCFLVQSVLLVPPSGYLVVFATVRLSYLRRPCGVERRGQTTGGGSIPRWSAGTPQSVVTRRKPIGAVHKKRSGCHTFGMACRG